MKYALFLLTAALVAAGLFWLSTTEGQDEASAAAPAVSTPPEPPEIVERTLVVAPDSIEAPQDVESTEDEDTPQRTAVEPTVLDEPEDPAAQEDADASGHLRVVVKARTGAPIPDAVIEVTALRSKERPNDVHRWASTVGPVTTNRRGTALVTHPELVRVAEGDEHEVAVLRMTVEHPRFVTEEVERVVDEDALVVLERGATLTVSGWIDSPDDWIVDVTPILHSGSRTTEEDWVVSSDGRPACHKLVPGPSSIAIRHEREGRVYTSEQTFFELEQGEEGSLHLQLLGPRALVGSLDGAVSRPVEEGYVMANVFNGTGETPSIPAERFLAEVEADGSFVLDDLPPGEVEVIGMCSGWVSATVPDPDNPKRLVSQYVAGDWPGHFVLEMVRAARVEVRALDPYGNPLPRVRVSMAPNVGWRNRQSMPFMGRLWGAWTDDEGWAVLTDLPPDDQQWLSLTHPSYQMPLTESPWNTPKRSAWIDLRSGDTTTHEVRMEPIGQ